MLRLFLSEKESPPPSLLPLSLFSPSPGALADGSMDILFLRQENGQGEPSFRAQREFLFRVRDGMLVKKKRPFAALWVKGTIYFFFLREEKNSPRETLLPMGNPSFCVGGGDNVPFPV